MRDPHSAARPEEARVTHVALDLGADFAAKTLAGTATLTLARTGSAPTLVLDTADLTISRSPTRPAHALSHALGARDPILGQPLTITLPPRRHQGRRRLPDVAAGARRCSGCRRRRPRARSSRTCSRRARRSSPARGSRRRTAPAIRQTYEARITVPAPLHRGDERRAAHAGRRDAARRPPPLRVPPDAADPAVPDRARRRRSRRSGRSARAPASTPSRRWSTRRARVRRPREDGRGRRGALGPYRWGRYDVLVLPPSFPFGGMENPR